MVRLHVQEKGRDHRDGLLTAQISLLINTVLDGATRGTYDLGLANQELLEVLVRLSLPHNSLWGRQLPSKLSWVPRYLLRRGVSHAVPLDVLQSREVSRFDEIVDRLSVTSE